MVAGARNIRIAPELNPFRKTTGPKKTTRAQTVVMRTSARLVTKPVIADGNDAPTLNLKPLTPKTMIAIKSTFQLSDLLAWKREGENIYTCANTWDNREMLRHCPHVYWVVENVVRDDGFINSTQICFSFTTGEDMM